MNRARSLHGLAHTRDLLLALVSLVHGTGTRELAHYEYTHEYILANSIA